MKEQRITIDIRADGKLTADAEGFSGGACLKELERLLEGFAAPPLKVDRKPGTAGAQVSSLDRVIAHNERKVKQ